MTDLMLTHFALATAAGCVVLGPSGLAAFTTHFMSSSLPACLSKSANQNSSWGAPAQTLAAVGAALSAFGVGCAGVSQVGVWVFLVSTSAKSSSHLSRTSSLALVFALS